MIAIAINVLCYSLQVKPYNHFENVLKIKTSIFVIFAYKKSIILPFLIISHRKSSKHPREY